MHSNSNVGDNSCRMSSSWCSGPKCIHAVALQCKSHCVWFSDAHSKKKAVCFYLCELFLTLGWCQVHLVPEQQKKREKTNDLCDSELLQNSLLSLVCQKNTMQLCSNFLLPWHFYAVLWWNYLRSLGCSQLANTVRICVIKAWSYKRCLSST